MNFKILLLSVGITLAGLQSRATENWFLSSVEANSGYDFATADLTNNQDENLLLNSSPGDPVDNLLESGNMESDSWTSAPGNTDLALTFVPGEGIDSSKAMVIKTSSMGGDENYQVNSDEQFHLENFSRISISFMARSSNPDIQLQAWIQEAGITGGLNAGYAVLSSDWKKYNFSIVIDKQTSDSYYFSFRASDTATIHIDNVMVGTGLFEDVPQSDIYDVFIDNNENEELINVFRSECPVYIPGYQGMLSKYKKPFSIFEGRTISWGKFTVNNPVTVKVIVKNTAKVPISGQNVKILPSRYGVTPVVNGNEITFTITEPAQYSVEVGEKGYENGLVLFADPPETDIPDPEDPQYLMLDHASAEDLTSIPGNYTGLYFKKGIHDIDVFHVPGNIKNIYFEDGSWVYGALIMDGNPDVRIYGRGILSQAKLDYRESHGVEAINGSDRIKLEGLVIADYKFFSVRLIGQYNEVEYVKVIGGWAWHCDGIAAYKGSTVSKCFIWANDDAIKVYRDSITWSDIVVWQLDNGGIIQMSWGGAIGGSTSRGVRLSRIDILHCEYDKPGFNTALLSCVGNHRKIAGKEDWIEDWIIEDVVTENPVQIVFGITPDPSTPVHIHGLTLKNWNVRMPLNTNYTNSIIGHYPEDFFDGVVFDSVVFNGDLLENVNYITKGEMDEGGWKGSKGNTNQVVLFDENSGIDNSMGLRSLVTDLGGDDHYLIICDENFRFVREGTLTLSFWAKANILNTRLTPFIEKNESSVIQEFEDVYLSGEWKKYTVKINPEVDFSADYKLKFRAYGLNTVLFLDEAEIGYPEWRTKTQMATQFLHSPLALPEVPIIHNPSSTKENLMPTNGIYPNPAGDVLNIKNSDRLLSYRIYNSNGKLELTGNGTTVNVSNLNPGIYILLTEKGEKMKFIKE